MQIRITKKIPIEQTKEWASYFILYTVGVVPFYQYCVLSHEIDNDTFILEMCAKWYKSHLTTLAPDLRESGAI